MFHLRDIKNMSINRKYSAPGPQDTCDPAYRYKEEAVVSPGVTVASLSGRSTGDGETMDRLTVLILLSGTLALASG